MAKPHDAREAAHALAGDFILDRRQAVPALIGNHRISSSSPGLPARHHRHLVLAGVRPTASEERARGRGSPG